jgi:hypothetical protein
MRFPRRALVGAVLVAFPAVSSGQILDLTLHDAGLAIGDKPRVNGVRINFRDRDLTEVHGVNITIWTPHEPATGVVSGLALGLPMTGAATIRGLGVGIVGVSAERSIKGIAIGGVGVGGGGHLYGIMLGGIGVGSGNGLSGLSIGGIGVGSGGAVRGVQVGGIGVGAGSDLWGISIGGIGVGSGGNATGLMIGGIGVGSGGTLKGLSIGGIGVGAPTVKGVVISGVGAGGEDVSAIVLTGGYFKVAKNGRFEGGSLSSVNDIRGSQHGLTIGLFNYARDLRGAQVGVINISTNDGHLRVLPILSVR